ncbi:hypothetical protein PCYB_005450, partial [Plasmodium cynomolgi strain B]
YMTYDKYSELKRRFDATRSYTSESISLDNILKASKIHESIKSKYKTVFSELFSYMNHPIIYYHNDRMGCWYISYILYKEVYNILNRVYTEELFNDFKEFILRYNRYDSSDNNACLNDMLYVEPLIFRIMDYLYRLYELYINYKTMNEHLPNPNCKDFLAFLYLYNSFVRTYKSGTTFFNNVLQNFHKEINNAVLNYQAKCTGVTFNVDNLNLYSPIKPPESVVLESVVKHENNQN